MQGTRGSRAEGAPRRRCSRPESTPMPRRNGGECSPVADEFLSISIDISVYQVRDRGEERCGGEERPRCDPPGVGEVTAVAFTWAVFFSFSFGPFFFRPPSLLCLGKRERGHQAVLINLLSCDAMMYVVTDA